MHRRRGRSSRSSSEQRAGAEEDESRSDRKREARIGEEAERVERDHEQRGEREHDENRCPARPAQRKPEEPDRNPDDRTREPARQLIQAQRKRGVAAAVGKIPGSK